MPTNPELINVAQETLGLRRPGFSPEFSLLMPAGSLLCSPPVLAIRLQPAENAPLPLEGPKTLKSAASVPGLSPVELSARNRLTSELLRFL